MADISLRQGDAWDLAARLSPGSINCVVTSPPYWNLRDYGMPGQFGIEPTIDEYIAKMVALFRLLRVALAHDGTVWLNMGDCYVGDGAGAQGVSGQRSTRRHTQGNLKSGMRPAELKPKNLVGMPWRVAFALQSDGWYLRQDIIWHKPNPMPESVRDRCTKAHEYLFLLSKSERYYYDVDAIRETPESKDARVQRHKALPSNWAAGEGSHSTLAHNTGTAHPKAMRSRDAGTYGLTRGTVNQPCAHPDGRNKRSVWTIPPRPFKEAHFATFPPDLVRPCIMAGCPCGGTVLDPFVGSGTVLEVARELGRDGIGFELNPAYVDIAMRRLAVSADA